MTRGLAIAVGGLATRPRASRIWRGRDEIALAQMSGNVTYGDLVPFMEILAGARASSSSQSAGSPSIAAEAPRTVDS